MVSLRLVAYLPDVTITITAPFPKVTIVPLMPLRVRVNLVQPLQKVIRLRRQEVSRPVMLLVPLLVVLSISIRLVLLPLPSPMFPQSIMLLVPRLKLHLTPTVVTLNRPETGLVLSRVPKILLSVLELPLVVPLIIVDVVVSEVGDLVVVAEMEEGVVEESVELL